MGHEFIGQRLARLDRLHVLIRVDFTGMKIHRVSHRSLIPDGDAESIPYFAAQGRAGRLPVEEPPRLAHSWGNLDFFLSHHPRFLVKVTFRRGKGGVDGVKSLTGFHALGC